MALEANQRDIVVSALAPLHAFAVENLVNPGTPDVFFVGGCLELKTAERWPVRGGVLKEGVSRDKFTPQQRIFARTWRRAQGFHCVCLQVVRDWFLIEGVAAATHLGIDWTEKDIRKKSWKTWVNGLHKEEFLTTIIRATEKSRGWEYENYITL